MLNISTLFNPQAFDTSYLTPSSQILKDHHNAVTIDGKNYSYLSRLIMVIKRHWQKILKCFHLTSVDKPLNNQDFIHVLKQQVSFLTKQVIQGDAETLKKQIDYTIEKIHTLAKCVSKQKEVREYQVLLTSCEKLKTQISKTLSESFNHFIHSSEKKILPSHLHEMEPSAKIVEQLKSSQVNATLEKLLGQTGFQLWKEMTKGVTFDSIENCHPYYTLTTDQPYAICYNGIVSGSMNLPQKLTFKISDVNNHTKIEFIDDSIAIKGLGQQFKIQSLTFQTDNKINIKISQPGFIVRAAIETTINQLFKRLEPQENHPKQSFEKGLEFKYAYVIASINFIGFKWTQNNA